MKGFVPVWLTTVNLSLQNRNESYLAQDEKMYLSKNN